MIKMRLIFAVTSTLIGYVFMTSIASAQGPPCECSNLKDLQTELNTARYLQQAFNNKIAVLKAMDGASAKRKFKEFFAVLKADVNVKKCEHDTGPNFVEFTPFGFNVRMQSVKDFSNEQLCAPDRDTVKDLAAVDKGACCAGIAAAVRAHEDFHQAVCMRVSYGAYEKKQAPDLAADEAGAYGAQIKVLRAEIARIFEHAEVSIQVVTTTRAEMPKNPLYTALNMKANGDLKVSSSPVFIDPIIRFDAKGQQTNTASIEGNCAITYGYPAFFLTHGTIETDGLEAQIHYSADGTSPASGMECHLPGEGESVGGSMPGPVNDAGYMPPAITLKLEDGAEVVTDMATTQAAAISAPVGITLTGKVTITLNLKCPPKK